MPHAERAAILAEFTPGHDVKVPAVQRAPFVFCSPHSGRRYPEHLRRASRLDDIALRKSEDFFVDDLFAQVPSFGAPLISALFPRAFLDVNREPYELDPELFGRDLPSYANTQSVRVAGGLGTVARIVSDGEEIYRSPPTLDAALARIEMLYHPFHAALDGLIVGTFDRFGMAILIDCHSMPSAAMSQMGGSRPDIVLGDRFGASCDPRLTRFVRDQLAKLGYQVQLNRPYAGGYITEHYGRPTRGVHALQIEINRALYMDERRIIPLPRYARLQRDIGHLCRVLFDEFGTMPEAGRSAAE